MKWVYFLGGLASLWVGTEAYSAGDREWALFFGTMGGSLLSIAVIMAILELMVRRLRRRIAYLEKKLK